MAEVERHHEPNAAVLGTILSLGYMPTFIEREPVTVDDVQNTKKSTRLQQFVKDIGRHITDAYIPVEDKPRQALVELAWRRTTYHYMAEVKYGYPGKENDRVVAFGRENDRLLARLTDLERKEASCRSEACLMDPLEPLLLARELTSTPMGMFILGDCACLDIS